MAIALRSSRARKCPVCGATAEQGQWFCTTCAVVIEATRRRSLINAAALPMCALLVLALVVLAALSWHFDRHGWNRVGLIIDLVGAALLSVEAIRLENVRAVKEWLKRRVKQLKGVMNDKLNITYFSRQATGLAVTLYVFVALFSSVRQYFYAHHLPGWMLALLALPAGGFAGESIMFAVLLFALLGTSCLIVALNFVEGHTPSGGIGMVGFVLIVAGFAFQLPAA